MVVDLDALLGKAYSAAEAAELLGISEEATRRLIRAKRLKAHRPPGRKSYVITGESIALYLNGGEPTPAMRAREAQFIGGRLGAVMRAVGGTFESEPAPTAGSKKPARVKAPRSRGKVEGKGKGQGKPRKSR